MTSANHLKRADFIFRNENDWEHILQRTLQKEKQELINELISSELKGRGGAGFPTGLKWKLASEDPTPVKYVICYADEGEPGTFKDREILSMVPFKVLTAMAICAYIIGTSKGYIYLRGEYKFLKSDLLKAIDEFENFCKEIKFDFTIKIFLGSGAYTSEKNSASNR
jgi:[NiFe] hydrogenase diaphorase moiety large subunit